MPESKKVLKERQRHVKDTQKLSRKGSHWLNLKQFENQNI